MTMRYYPFCCLACHWCCLVCFSAWIAFVRVFLVRSFFSFPWISVPSASWLLEMDRFQGTGAPCAECKYCNGQQVPLWEPWLGTRVAGVNSMKAGLLCHLLESNSSCEHLITGRSLFLGQSNGLDRASGLLLKHMHSNEACHCLVRLWYCL